jgi:hypothetical protein
VCEEFQCLPEAAVKAIENDVGFLLFKILDFRAYSRAKEIYDSTPMDKRPKNSMMDKVSEITMGLAKERIEKIKESDG